MAKILIAQGQGSQGLVYRRELGGEGHEVVTALLGPGLLERIAREQPDLVGLEMGPDAGLGLQVLLAIRDRHYRLPVILCWTAGPGGQDLCRQDLCRQDLRTLAADYGVCHSPDLAELKVRIAMALEANLNP
jgi:CheY-like chemotaxis protein